MNNVPDADVEDYLLTIAEKDPDKIINLYTGDDITYRLLFVEARDKHVINYKNKIYVYGDNVVLGATDDAAVTWLKDPKNKRGNCFKWPLQKQTQHHFGAAEQLRMNGIWRKK